MVKIMVPLVHASDSAPRRDLKQLQIQHYDKRGEQWHPLRNVVYFLHQLSGIRVIE